MPAKLRFPAIVLLLSGVAVFLQLRAPEQPPRREPLAALPIQMGRWQGVDEPISPGVLQTLGQGDFLQRAYVSVAGIDPVQVFIAYLPTQRTGDVIHSPQNCLPGSGWSPLESGRIFMSVPGHVRFEANRFLVGNREDRQLVLYWYLSHDRAVASEYHAKFYLVEDSIRLNRSDGAVIRLSTELRPRESEDQAQSRLVEFAQALVPLLSRYVPR